MATTKKTQQKFNGNGSDTYQFTIELLNNADLKVYVDGVLQTENTDYSISGSSITFDTVKLADNLITIVRDTDIDAPRGTFAAGSSIRARDLTNNQDQVLFSLQEKSYVLEAQASDTAPVAPSTGDRWFDTVSGRNYVYFTSNGVSQWVDQNPATDVSGGAVSDNIVNNNIATNAGIAASKLSFTQTGTGAVARTIDSKLNDVVSVKDFGAVGNGSADDATAIQAAVDYSSSSGGKAIFFPVGTYKVNTPINLKTYATLVGDNAKLTTILGGGNHPVFQHLGSSSNTVGQVSIRHMHIRGNGALSNGAYTIGDKSFGIVCDWAADWLIEDVDFSYCKIGYFQGSSRNNILSKLDFILCYDCLWFGPIDNSGGGTPDNTVFIDTIDAVTTINCGMRIEGITGMKIINSSFVQGVEGIYTGDYNPTATPRYILDNSYAAPTVANTRRIRFLHLNNVYTDGILTTAGTGYNPAVSTVNGSTHTGSGIGYRFMPIANDNPIEDVRIVNCWAGNTDSVSAAMHFKSIVNLQIVGSSIVNALGRGILVNGVNNDTEETYNGTGSQTVFPTQITHPTTSDLQVFVGDVLKTLTTHYTISTNNVSSSADYGKHTITFTSGNAPASGTGNVKINIKTDPTTADAGHRDTTKNIVINGLVIEDFDRNNQGLAGVEVITANGVAINNVSGDADRQGATSTQTPYLVKLNDCSRNVISNLTTNDRLIQINNCNETAVSNCISTTTISPVLVESGTTSKSIITNCITNSAITLLSGNGSIKSDNIES